MYDCAGVGAPSSCGHGRTLLTKAPVAPAHRNAVASLAAAAALLTGPASAGAVTCWGDYCSGKDPNATGCANGAYTVAYVQLPGVQQRLELRWSPTCRTNWARILYDPNPSWIRAVQRETGYVQWFSASNGTNSWSRMIYSPYRCVYAEVQTRYWGRYATSCR